MTTQCTYGLANQPVSQRDVERRRKFFTSTNNQQLADARKQLLSEWESLLYDYSVRTLTKESDKFPAISGIAKEFHVLLNDEYVAGLWSCTLPHSLLWHGRNDKDADIDRLPVPGPASTGMGGLVSSFRDLRTGQPSTSLASETYIAPSWSPFQNKGPVLTEVVYDYVWPNRPRTLARVKSFSTTLANYQAPFGAIRSGRLEIEAPVARFSLDKLAANFVVWADGEAAQSVTGKPHASFRLKTTGGSVALARNQQGTRSVFDYLDYPGVPGDQSFGSSADGWWDSV